MPRFPEWREDPLRGWRTLVAPARGERPVDPEVGSGSASAAHGSGRSPHEAHQPPPAPGAARPGCPFCAGSEAELGQIVHEATSEEGWVTRAVLNRYRFLATGEGVQEVLIETPRHEADFVDLGEGEAVEALRLYRSRVRAQHRAHPGWEVHLFRNRGREAGTSRRHPHAQLVALPGPTPARASLERAQRDHHAAHGECLVCREIELAAPTGATDRPEGGRTIHVGEHFVVATLHAPLDPYHLRIFPRRHASSIAGLEEDEMASLARVLRTVLAAVDRATGRASYNLLVHGHGPEPGPALHWHIELRPRIGRTAGFEQMTGLAVCPSDPEADAAALSAHIRSSRTND